MISPTNAPVHGHPPEMAQVVERNIRALLTRRQEEERHRPLQDRIAGVVTRFTGSMLFVYLHLALVAGWVAANLGLVPGVPRFDPSFVILASFASVEAIFLSTFVLITQNRMAELADQRADLDLQVSLLSEHEVTRLVSLVTQIAQRMGIEDAHDPELDELARDVAPEKVMDRMEEHQRGFEPAEGREV